MTTPVNGGVDAPGAVAFDEFVLDAVAGTLLRGDTVVQLTGRAFALLDYLVRHPGKLISKEELLDTVWGGRIVSDAALSKRLQEVRRVLGDPAHKPRFIETVARRGYRFVGSVQTRDRTAPGVAVSRIASGGSSLIGRRAELTALSESCRDALAERRRLIVVRGAAGTGKTTLLRHFLGSARADLDASLVTTVGQCVEVGADAFLPLIDALSRICHGAAGEWMVDVLEQTAPAWLLDMPALLDAAQVMALRRRTRGTTSARRQRELAEALETASAAWPIVLVVEDVHWADASTLAWLNAMARRPDPARLLVIASLRSGEPLSATAQNILDQLAVDASVAWLELDGFDRAHVARWFEERLAEDGDPAGLPLEALSRWLHQQTEGNPLFLRGIVDGLLRDGHLAVENGRWVLLEAPEQLALTAPSTVRALISRRLRRLAPDQVDLVSTASVFGGEFDAPAVAAVLASDTEPDEERVERGLLALVRDGGLIESAPDDNTGGAFRFAHELLREAVYQEIGPARRRRLHLLAGETLERQQPDRAGSFARHFERAGDDDRAATAYLNAGRQARARSAFVESERYLRAGLDALSRLPASADTGRELEALTMLGASLVARHGYTHPDVRATYRRAAGLCGPASDPVAVFASLHGLRDVALLEADLAAVGVQQDAIGALAARTDDPHLNGWNMILAGEVDYARGDLETACGKLRDGCERYPRHGVDPYFDSAWIRPDIGAMCYEALALSELGYAATALERVREAEREADDFGYPMSRAFVLYNAAQLHISRQELAPATDYTTRLRELADRYGLALQSVWAQTLEGYCLVHNGDPAAGSKLLASTLETLEQMGSRLGYGSAMASYAGALARLDRVEEAERLFDDAIAKTEATGEPVRALTLRGVKAYTLLEHPRYAEQLWREFEQVYRTASDLNARSWQIRAALGRVLLLAGGDSDAGRMVPELERLRRCYDDYPEHGELEELKFVSQLLEGYESA